MIPIGYRWIDKGISVITIFSEQISVAMNITMDTLGLLKFYNLDSTIKVLKITTTRPLTIMKFKTILLHQERLQVTESLSTK
jgi:hypothetical protein